MLRKLRSSRLNEFVSPDFAVSLLRIGVALLILTHGTPKLMNILNGEFAFSDPIGIGPVPTLFLVAFAEFFCALFVLAGLFTRIALVPLLINMSVAFFIYHANDPFPRKELTLFFLISFAFLFLTGPGSLSLDRIFRR